MAVVGAAALLRLVTLGFPGDVYFDETYYANDARVYLLGVRAYERPIDYEPSSPPSQAPPSQGLLGEKSWVHPPLGKWAIALGEFAFGSRSPWGRRVVPALFGILTVVLVYRIGLEVMPGRWACLAAGLAALDGLLIVQSRIAMLDSILAAFLCLGFLCLIRDRHLVVAADRHKTRPWYGTRFRLAAGFAMGAALATKWSGALGLAVGAALLIGWSASRGRLRAEAPGIVVAFLAVPALVYLASYTLWFVEHGFAPGGFLALQRKMFDYHRALRVEHPYKSNPAGWLFLLRPVAYYFSERAGRVHHILALGNPAVWWSFVPASLGLVALSMRRREWGARATLSMFAALYVPWLIVHRPLFLFYMTPAVPFMALGLAQTMYALPRRARAPAASLVAGAAIVAAALLVPLWIGYGVGSAWWERLMIFRSWI